MTDILDEAQEFVTDASDTEAVELVECLCMEIEDLREKLKDANYRLESAGVPTDGAPLTR